MVPKHKCDIFQGNRSIDILHSETRLFGVLFRHWKRTGRAAVDTYHVCHVQCSSHGCWVGMHVEVPFGPRKGVCLAGTSHADDVHAIGHGNMDARRRVHSRPNGRAQTHAVVERNYDTTGRRPCVLRPLCNSQILAALPHNPECSTGTLCINMDKQHCGVGSSRQMQQYYGVFSSHLSWPLNRRHPCRSR